jgi:hypothetical protein
MIARTIRPRHLLSILVLSLVVPAAVAAASLETVHEAELSVDLSWSVAADGAHAPVIDGGRPLGATGRPDLPVRDLMLLVPADLAVRDVVIEPLAVRREALPGRLAEAGPLVTSSGEMVPVTGPEEADGVFPASWGEFGGLHSWRGYRLMAVTLHPVRVVESGGVAHLEVLERFAVKAVVDGPAPAAPLARERLVPGERQSLEASLRTLVANPAALGGYAREDGAKSGGDGGAFMPAPLPSTEGSAVRYLIVTSENLAGEFQRLADHRTAMGLPAAVVTREWISANCRHGIDFQETMRMFLQDAYAKWGVEYLLIGGDTDIIPTRFVRSTFYPFGGHTDIPTDLYYAGLDGNWAADGDGWLGEPYISPDTPGDDADFAPELSHSRAPVRTPLGASQFIDKLLAYELATPADAYAGRILYAAEVLFPSPWNEGDTITLDGAQYAHNLIQNVIEPCTDMEYVRMYETDQLYVRDAPLSRSALIDSLNTGHYGQVDQFGHGHFFNMSVGDANFTVGDAGGLHNGPNYFLLFALNCASGAFDVSCLMEAFVENPQGGSIMSVGAAREAFPSNSFAYQTLFYDGMACAGVGRAVDAFVLARMQYVSNTLRNTVDRWTQLNAAFVGDPAVTIWNGVPVAPQITAPASLTAGEQVVSVQVLGGGQPVAGADVCLNKDGETYARAVTDAQGDVDLTVIPATGGVITLTVSGAGLAHTVTEIPVTPSAAYVALTDLDVQDGGANGNGALEAGETADLALTFSDVGGAGATGLTVTLTSADPQVQVIDGTASLGDVAPGGAVSNLDPLTVSTAVSLRDGTAVPLRLVVADGGGQQWVSEATLTVIAPEVEVSRLDLDDAVHGDGDGVIEAGERIVLRPWLKNYGAGRLDGMTLTLTDAAAGVTIDGASATCGPLGLLEESTVTSGELSVTLADPGQLNPCRLHLVDSYGRSMQLWLQFTTPPSPPAPETDATLAPDAIALRWDPAGGEEILGYHVYRSLVETGPFVRANQDLIRGVSYYEDRGLEQLTPYFYRVTAVDTFMVEGDASVVVSQGTMPGEVTNFPLPFELQTSSHPAVGDVDGDGLLEIVLAADEVYAWNHDGSELVDGDDDSQTTGPLTGVGGQFEPSGVALADLDGDGAMEIIASERLVSRQIHVYKADGSMLPGWPRTLQSSWNWATPAVGDIDGDGDPEVIVNDTGGRTFVWHHDGTEFRDGDNDPATDGVFIRRSEGWGYSSPTLYDLDGDGACEMIFGTRYWNSDNALLAYKHDGTQAPGFPFATGSAIIICSPAVADLDRDGVREVIFFTEQKRLYVLETDGTSYPGFPKGFSSNWDDNPGPSPAVGNFDDDPDYEIVWPVNGGAFRMDLILVDTGREDGTSGDTMTGWPVQLPCNSEGSPVVGDIDGDGYADIIQPVGNSDTETPDRVYALNRLGEDIAGFPIRLDGHCRSTPIICDIEDDGDVDIVYGSWDRLLHVWDMPFPYDPILVPWPQFKGDAERTGVLRQVSVTPVEDQQVPQAFTVLPPHPNPFNPATHIRFYVAPGADTRVQVDVYDLRGRRVRSLQQGDLVPGWHDLTWDGRDDGGRGQSSGVYVLRARQAGRSQAFKMTLVK